MKLRFSSTTDFEEFRYNPSIMHPTQLLWYGPFLLISYHFCIASSSLVGLNFQLLIKLIISSLVDSNMYILHKSIWESLDFLFVIYCNKDQILVEASKYLLVPAEKRWRLSTICISQQLQSHMFFSWLQIYSRSD